MIYVHGRDDKDHDRDHKDYCFTSTTKTIRTMLYVHGRDHKDYALLHGKIHKDYALCPRQRP